jgi:hypothetical protein
MAGPKTHHEQRVAAQSSRSFRVLALADVQDEWFDQARDIDVLIDPQVTRGSAADLALPGFSRLSTGRWRWTGGRAKWQETSCSMAKLVGAVHSHGGVSALWRT